MTVQGAIRKSLVCHIQDSMDEWWACWKPENMPPNKPGTDSTSLRGVASQSVL